MTGAMSNAREELTVGAETDLHPIAEADPDPKQAKHGVIIGDRRARIRLKFGTDRTLTPGSVWVDDRPSPGLPPVSDHAALEVYEAARALVRTIAMTRDEHDETKWLMAEGIALGRRDAEKAVARFADGTSKAFASTAPINTIFL
jgi:hypothetical protein